MATDQSYIDRTLSGDTNAFAYLVEKYQHMVFTLCVRIVGGREEAEEVAQDVFVKAFTKLGEFKGKSKFSTWLYKIAYYGSLDAVRRSGREIATEHLETVGQTDTGVVQDALTYMEEQERSSLIAAALEKLPPDMKTLMTLYYYEEMSIKEVAKVMQLSQDNVKVKLFRARKRMHGLLQNVVTQNTPD